MEENRSARCLSCDERYPAATGVCPHCGAPPLAMENQGSPYRVVVPDIPSGATRAALVTALGEVLDCLQGPGELDARLARGNVNVLCGGLSHEAAQMLAGFLRKQHVSPLVEPDTPAGAGGRKLPIGVGLLVLGAVLFFVPGDLGGWIAGGLSGAAGLLFIAFALASGAYRRSEALCLPRGGGASLPGWEPMPGSLARLLLGLDESSRAALSGVAVDVAHVQDAIAAHTMAGIAAGGPGGGLDQAARKLLTNAIAASRRIVDEKGDPRELGEKLSDLARMAREARARFEALESSAAVGGAVASAEAGETLSADLDAELAAAARVIEEGR